MQTQIKGPIFLVGCPRSGTTLLQQMLDAHPTVAIAPETHFMRLFWLRRDHYGDLTEEANYYRLIENITALPEFSEMGLSNSDFSEAAWTIERTYPAIFRLLLEQFAEKRGAQVVGEKTPNHVLHIPTLQQFFPTARFIHLVRDPRAVVNSWQSVPWSTGSITGNAEMWRYYVSSGRRSASHLHIPVYTLSYEQLVLAPEENLRSLCHFLDLEFTPAMLAYHQKAEHLVNVTREPWKANSVTPLNHTALNRWQRELSQSMVAEIEAVVWFEMKRFQYKAHTNLIQLLPTATSTGIQREFKYLLKRINYHTKRIAW